MKITLDQARQLSKTGLLFVCASCTKWHRGAALGMKCCTANNCGSVVARKDFPEYEGTLSNFSDLCFVCGSESVVAYAKVEGSEKQFGMCQCHLEVIDTHIVRSTYNQPMAIKKVFIFPRRDMALEEFRNAQHTL